MKYCKTCRHWDKGKGKGGKLWGICKRADFYDGEVRDKESLAFASDMSEYSAGLNTHEDFGCVQHLDVLEE